ADRTLVPVMLLERGGERLAGLVGTLLVVGDDEGDVVAGDRADIGDHHRDVRLLRQAQYAWRGRGIRRRDQDAVHLARDRILRVLELRRRIVVGVVVGDRSIVLLRLVGDAGGKVTPERQV